MVQLSFRQVTRGNQNGVRIASPQEWMRMFRILGFGLQLWFVGFCSAQISATLSGTVKDTTGAVTPGAAITVRSEQTGYSRSALADSDGSYLFPLLPLGTYSVSAEHSGFKKVDQKGVVLTVNQNVRVDLVLPVGDVAETVTVSAEVAQVDTRQAS